MSGPGAKKSVVSDGADIRAKEHVCAETVSGSYLKIYALSTPHCVYRVREGKIFFYIFIGE